jgi:ribosome-binding protein aMBF1 (putative translation factor)
MAVVGAVKGLEQIEDAEEQRPMAPELDERIREARKGGLSVHKAAAKFGVDPSTVQRISRPFVEASVTA